MTAALASKGRRLAAKALGFQSLVAIIVVALFASTLGSDAAFSAAWGALTCLLPGAVFAILAFRYAGASKNKLVVRSFNQGSKIKLLLTFILFVLAFAWLNLQPGPLFSGFAITMVAQWVAMLRLRH